MSEFDLQTHLKDTTPTELINEVYSLQFVISEALAQGDLENAERMRGLSNIILEAADNKAPII